MNVYILSNKVCIVWIKIRLSENKTEVRTRLIALIVQRGERSERPTSATWECLKNNNNKD